MREMEVREIGGNDSIVFCEACARSWSVMHKEWFSAA